MLRPQNNLGVFLPRKGASTVFIPPATNPAVAIWNSARVSMEVVRVSKNSTIRQLPVASTLDVCVKLKYPQATIRNAERPNHSVMNDDPGTKYLWTFLVKACPFFLHFFHIVRPSIPLRAEILQH